MTDQEWDGWHKAFSGSDSPLPKVERHVRRWRLRFILGTVCVFAIVSAEVSFAVWKLHRSTNPIVLAGEIGSIAFGAIATLVYVLLAMRTGQFSAQTPREMLEAEMRYVDSARPLKYLMYVMVGLALPFGLVLSWYAHHALKDVERELIVCAGALVLIRAVAWWSDRRFAARRKIIEDLRHQLDDPL